MAVASYGTGAKSSFAAAGAVPVIALTGYSSIGLQHDYRSGLRADTLIRRIFGPRRSRTASRAIAQAAQSLWASIEVIT